jgi:hypothetical protein
MQPVIESIFATLPGQKRAHALRLRDIILEVHPKIVERIKWGNLTFVYNENNSPLSTVLKQYPILIWLFLRVRCYQTQNAY